MSDSDPSGHGARIVFAMTGAGSTTGGIASCNLNVLWALKSLSAEKRKYMTVLSLYENDDDRPDFLDASSEFVGFCGNRWNYTLKLLSLFGYNVLFIFDHVRLALPLIPVTFFGFRNFVIMAHGSESWKHVRRSSKWLFRTARLCLTNSQYTLSKMRATFSGFQGVSCLLGLSPVHSTSADAEDSSEVDLVLQAVDGKKRRLGARMILLVGRMDRSEREKGHAELLSIWPSVLRDFPESQLVFAGPGNDRASLMGVAEDLQVASSVFIPGHLQTSVLRDLYSRCCAFVMPSRQEGFGLVYLEAMNAGKPCVACRDGGGEEIVVDGTSGLLLDNPYLNEDLLHAVLRLSGDAVLAKRLGEQGRRRINEVFTSAHAQSRLIRYLAPLVPCA